MIKFFSKEAMLENFLNINKNLLILISLIFSFGLVLLYSASKGNIRPWAVKQFIYYISFLPLCFLIAIIDIKFWFRYSYFIYSIGVILLIIVEIIGYKSMGATRWINLGVIKIQPSEIMKICLILALGRYFFQNNLSNIKDMKKLIKPIIMFIIPCFLILKQPNLGTALILTAITVGIFFLVGVEIWKFVICIVLVLLSIPVIWKFGLRDYQKQRVLTFLNPESDPLNSGYNITQSKIAIGSGGLWGNGFLKGTQTRLEFLPEKHTDFIFTILCEEFGFMGAMFVIVMYFIMFVFFIYIIIKCNHTFGRVLVSGVLINLFCHFFINIGMITGLLPVVGTPFPLLTYGGSITVSTLISIGFVLNVNLHINEEIKLLV